MVGMVGMAGNGGMAGDFDGRTVIVTGAGSGIGRATATSLLQQGARVLAAD
ncbi:MAG: SDR family NAD(P)-dependent oxidoreductase, partial [Actinomycetales bacterium]